LSIASAPGISGVRAARDDVLAPFEVVWVGSTGCDGDDAACRDRPVEQRILRALRIDADGELEEMPDFAGDVGGLPAWLTMRRRPGRTACLFITRPDRDDVLAVPLGADGRLGAGRFATGSGGHNPVHASVLSAPSADRPDFLLVANYNGPDDTSRDIGASVASMQIGQQCELSPLHVVEHHGRSVDPKRQNAAHVHSIVVGRAGLAYMCDLGTDEVFTYRVDLATGELKQLARLTTKPGAGPRHSVLHPSMRVLYVVCEMDQTVLVISVDENTGALALLQEVSLLPDEASRAGSKAAEIVISPDGKHVYATNRGKVNKVIVLSVNSANGTLRLRRRIPAPAYPRGMTLANGGTMLLVAGQSSGEVVAFDVLPDGDLLLRSRLFEGDGVPPNPGAFLVLGTGTPLMTA